MAPVSASVSMENGTRQNLLAKVIKICDFNDNSLSYLEAILLQVILLKSFFFFFSSTRIRDGENVMVAAS